ncbi:Rrf2 family transcriptional regulator, partial [Faecalibaculum rodentium]
KYLEQIVIALNPTGILTSNRGFQGGYRLARAPREVTVFEVLEATEDSMAPVVCLRSQVNTCPRQEQCATLSLWTGLYNVVREYLEGITLQQLLDENAAMAGNDYVI